MKTLNKALYTLIAAFSIFTCGLVYPSGINASQSYPVCPYSQTYTVCDPNCHLVTVWVYDC